ncbi:aminopeptidase [Paludicola sp. MB14-C6]|uniref:aminopeptidase n=1 Tax=Paludihabitans sp. MB14-C6 TaxID=3070656 RepID=UPI0027DB5D09|nr:aminopeptidase [Paludicola sp. MB14-C6]WMJ22267.1 aminopeptidase [Paludicola sp. MB14-C6]
MENEKSIGQKLQDELLINRKNGGIIFSDEELKKVDAYCEGYKKFLDDGKTEREVVINALEAAKKHGFVEFELNKKYAAGDKVYYNNRGKALILAIYGTEPIEKGVNIMASHIDSPRIDLKCRPLYEEAEIAYFKTHYYGGIKKYQWTAMPLSLHGVVIKADGTPVTICIGEDETDPVFCITDLLPHLAQDQMKRTVAEAIKGEELNVVVGSRPFKDDAASEKVKLNIMKAIFEKYDIVESDFLSAELELVPAFKAKDIGFDRSLVGAYGQDDRVCAYTSFTATLEAKDVKRTLVTILADKEEVGSDGNTGLNSSYLKYFIADLAKPFGIEGRTVLSHSKCLSADVNAAFDPTFPEVTEKKNVAYVNYGVVVTKYTGARGKSGTSDASAEFVGEVNRMLTKEGVLWQHGELGKVDQGGGGTVAAYVANLNVDVIDIGVPVLSMHAPFEMTSKIDVYSTYKAFTAFAKHV